MINIKTEFSKSNFNYDRRLNVYDILPFKNEYLIQPNELSYYKAFNMKLSYLYDNFLYIYSRCFVANFEVPTTYTGFIGVTGTSIGIYQNFTNSMPFSNAGFSNLDNAKNATVYKDGDSYYFFINCLSAINVLRYNGNNNFCQACPNIISTVDPVSGELRFQKISDVSVFNDKYLCVTDEKLDIVYKYDLETYFSNDNIYKQSSSAFGRRLFLQDSVGSQGGRYNSIKFETPTNMATYGELILIEDYGNKILKLYDSHLNFLSYKTLLTLYKNITSFQNIKFKDENTIYGITENGYYVFDIDSENYKITLNSFQSLSSVLYDNEIVIDLEFCKYEKDIFYILTDKALIKKWEYRKDEIIGRKNASDFGTGSEFKWISTATKTLSSDNIYIYAWNSTANANQILIYEDELDLISIFGNDDFKVYSKNDIFVKKNEWNQAWVYEKNLKKLVKNIDLLKNNIYYNLIRKDGDFGSITDIKKIYNQFLFISDQIEYKKDFVIGVNENFQASVINRELDKIYDLEEKTLDFVNLDNSLDYYANIDVETPLPSPTPTSTPNPTPTITPTITPTPTVTPTQGQQGLVTFINLSDIVRFDSNDPLFPFA